MIIAVVLSSLVLTLTPALGASLGNVHGTVIDEDGAPLEDVKISMYLGTGSLQDTDYSDEDGYFRMNLGGTYTFVFEKTGYVTLEKTVQVTQAPSDNPSNDIVKLGEIILERTLELSSPVVKRLTTPGNRLTFGFTVINRGEETEDIIFSTIVPTGWDVKILDSIGEIENIMLKTGSNDYDFEISVPATATSVEVITLTVTGTSTATLDFTIMPKVYTDEIELKSIYLSVSEEKGQNIELPLTVSNLGEVDKKVTLSGYIPAG